MDVHEEILPILNFIGSDTCSEFLQKEIDPNCKMDVQLYDTLIKAFFKDKLNHTKIVEKFATLGLIVGKIHMFRVLKNIGIQRHAYPLTTPAIEIKPVQGEKKHVEYVFYYCNFI